MSEKKQVGREFQPVSDPDEAAKLLNEAAKTVASAMIWTKNQETSLETTINLYSQASGMIYAWVPRDFDPSYFASKLRTLADPSCYFSISLSRANIFFRTSFLGFDSGGLQFKIPSQIFKVQRRREVRYRIPAGHVLKVQFDDPLFADQRTEKKVHDLSANGVAFLAPEDEAPIYHTKLQLKNISFRVNGRLIEVDGEVKHANLVKIGSKSFVKVGVHLSTIKPGESQHIAGYIFEESRRNFSRYF